jgi:hypothetical protein
MDEGQRKINARKRKSGGAQWVATTIQDLEMLIGPKATADLIHYFGGCCVYIPSAQRIRAKLLKEKVCNMFYEKGMAKKQIEKELGWIPYKRSHRNRLNRYLQK